MTDPAKKECPLCGQMNKQTAKNCTQCGTPFYLAEVEGEMRKRCSKCGRYNRMSAKVCPQCGTRYEKVVVASRGSKPKWCPRCGAERKPGAKVCTHCGYHFVAIPSVPQVSQSNTLTDPKTVIEPPDLSGEPAPYISPEQLRDIRLQGREAPDFLIRVMQALLGNKKP